MAATMKATENDVHVTFEDQQRINKFARHNAKLQDLKEELISKKKDLQNLEDATDELLLEDDLIGEVFVNLTVDEANDMLEKAKRSTEEKITDLDTECENHKQILSDLKVQLYAKFGNNINLEAEED